MLRSADAAGRAAIGLDAPVQFLKGVGPKREEELASQGIRTVGDLLDCPPFRYEDRTEFRTLRSLREGEWVLTRGRICSVGSFDAHRRMLSVFEILVQDTTGSVELRFFNQPYLRNVYRPTPLIDSNWLKGESSSDDHAGLKKAIVEILPSAVWQRCYVHFLRNALDYLPRRGDDD